MTAQVDHEVDTPKYKSVRFLTRRSKIRTLVRHPRPPPRSPCRSCALSDDLSPPAPHAPSRWPDRQWAPAAFARRPQRARPLIQVLAPPLSRPTRRCGLSFNGRHASRDRHGAVDSASTGCMQPHGAALASGATGATGGATGVATAEGALHGVQRQPPGRLGSAHLRNP